MERQTLPPRMSMPMQMPARVLAFWRWEEL